MNVITGKLKLKGSFGTKMEKKEDKVKRQIEEDQVKQAEEIFKKDHNLTEEDLKPTIITFQPVDCDGRIITSSTTIQGEGTRFSEHLKKDDFILVEHPQSLVTEERQIACVMSDRSILLYKPFSSDIMSMIQFRIRKQDVIEEKEESIEDTYKKRLLGLTKKIHKDKDTQVTEFREKKGMWGYSKVRQEVDKNQSREKILDQRAKKGRDKFCWV